MHHLLEKKGKRSSQRALQMLQWSWGSRKQRCEIERGAKWKHTLYSPDFLWRLTRNRDCWEQEQQQQQQQEETRQSTKSQLSVIINTEMMAQSIPAAWAHHHSISHYFYSAEHESKASPRGQAGAYQPYHGNPTPPIKEDLQITTHGSVCELSWPSCW